VDIIHAAASPSTQNVRKLDVRAARDEVEVAVGIPEYEGRRGVRARSHAVEGVIVPGPGHVERLAGEANILEIAHPSVPRPDGKVQITCGGRVLLRSPPLPVRTRCERTVAVEI
jgi:hypothetical protein